MKTRAANLGDQDSLGEEERLRLAVFEAQNSVDALAQDLNATAQQKQRAQNAFDDARAAHDQHVEPMQLGALTPIQDEETTLLELQQMADTIRSLRPIWNKATLNEKNRW